MDYKGKTVALTGADGFLGSALADKLRFLGANVKVISGDTRKIETFTGVVDYQTDYLFHFGSPSSQVLFERNPIYCAEATIKGFINAVSVCKYNGVKLIYPSSGSLSLNEVNSYSRCKKLCEEIHLGDNVDAIGIRVFATYGPNENHKRDFASVPFLFARDILEGKRPVVFGSGEQSRDFIFVDDTVNGILNIAERANEKIIDLGFGKEYTFNQIIETINTILNKKVEPVFVDKPMNYLEHTKSDNDILRRYYIPQIGIDEGIEKIIKSLQERMK